MVAGQVDATVTGAPALLPQVRSGRQRALAVSSAQRISTLPGVPTVAERGYPGVEADPWCGIVAPAGTPPAVVARLSSETNRLLVRPEMVAQLGTEGAVPMPTTARAFGEWIARGLPRWAAVVRAGQVKSDGPTAWGGDIGRRAGRVRPLVRCRDANP